MRINKISKSDSFDLYSHVLSDFLSKKNNLQIKTAGIGSAIFSFFGRGGRAAQDFFNSLLTNGTKGSEIKKLLDEVPDVPELMVDGRKILNVSDAKVINLWGDILNSVNDASKASAAGMKERISTEMLEILWGSEENLELFYKLAMLKGAGESNRSGLQKLVSFDSLYNDEVARITNLVNDTPIVKDPDTYEVFQRAIARRADDPDFLKKTPKDVDELRRWLDMDPADATRRIGDLTEELGRAKDFKIEEVERAAREAAAAAAAGNKAESERLISLLETKISKDLREMNEGLKKAIRAGDTKLAEQIAKNAKKIEPSIIGTLGKSYVASKAMKGLFVVAAIIGGGTVIKSGYDWLFGEDSGESSEESSELRQGDKVTISPEKVDAERAIEEGDDQAIQKILSDPDLSDDTLEFITNKYKKDKAYKLPQPFDGMTYVFMSDEPGGMDIDEPADESVNLNILIEALNDRKTGMPIYNSLVGSLPSKQHALNEAATDILEKGLYLKRRSKRYQLGKGTKGREGIGGFERRPLSRKQRRGKRRERKMASNVLGRFEKLSHLKEISLDSTNNQLNNDTNLLKKADEVSKSYVKDAVKDLNHEDKTLREYFTGLGRLYDAESEKRNPDKKELYELHDETGRDLTLSAHPKAIRVSEGLGNGGLVENGLEQKEKLEDVALRTPTGNFESRYAKLKHLFNKSSKT